MYPEISIIPGAISQIMASVAENKALTVSDRYGLMAALLNDSLDEEEKYAINRLLRFVVKGKIKMSLDTLDFGKK